MCTIKKVLEVPPELFLQRGVLKICCKYTGKHPCGSVIPIKLLCNFIEIALLHGCAPVNLLHIFKTLFYKNTSGGMLLKCSKQYSGYSQQYSKHYRSFNIHNNIQILIFTEMLQEILNLLRYCYFTAIQTTTSWYIHT